MQLLITAGLLVALVVIGTFVVRAIGLVAFISQAGNISIWKILGWIVAVLAIIALVLFGLWSLAGVIQSHAHVELK